MLAAFTSASVVSAVRPFGTPSASDSLAERIRLGEFTATGDVHSDGFHLGNAAGVFGWSSAVADFNDDGEPDFTVADRQSGSAGGYSYRILFGVAGRAAQSVSFKSFSSTLNVSVRDVDHDDDLDVLLTEAPSATVDSVWLNDGHGRFVRSDAALPSTASVADDAFESTPDSLSPTFVAPDRFAARRAVPSDIGHVVRGRAVFHQRDLPHAALFEATAPSRAPPTVAFLLA